MSKVFGDNLNNIIDATIGNIYFRNTGIGLHKDTTEPNNNIGVYGIVLGNSYDLQVATEETDNSKFGKGTGSEISIEMNQGTAYKFGITTNEKKSKKSEWKPIFANACVLRVLFYIKKRLCCFANENCVIGEIQKKCVIIVCTQVRVPAIRL